MSLHLIHLIRHGQASAGAANYDQLSATGEHQARLLGDWWAAQGLDIVACGCGTMQRQIDTAKRVMEAMPRVEPNTLQQWTGLDEYPHRTIDRNFATDGQVSDAAAGEYQFADYLHTLERWRQASRSGALPDGVEGWDEFGQRTQAALQGFITDRLAENHPSRPGHPPIMHSALFTSGGVIGVLLGSLLELSLARIAGLIWHCRNSSITTLAVHGEHIELVQFNAVPHLEAAPDGLNLITLI